MLHKAVRMMCPEDYSEYCALKRRMEFLELRVSPLWQYRRANVEQAYADVKDGLKLKTKTKPE